MRISLVYFLWLSAVCQGLQLNFDRKTMPPDGIRSPCGVLACSEENGPITNTGKITSGDTLHPITLPPPNSETILSMSVFKTGQNETSGGGAGGPGKRLLVANISTGQDEVHYESDSLNVEGALTDKQASLRLEMFDPEDCDARYEVEVITVDKEARRFVSIAQTTLHQSYESEKPHKIINETSAPTLSVVEGGESGISDGETMKKVLEILTQLLSGQESLEVKVDVLKGRFVESEKQLEEEFNSLRREVINFEKNIDGKVISLDEKINSVSSDISNVKVDPNQVQEISDVALWLKGEIPTLKQELNDTLVSIKENLENDIGAVEKSLTNQVFTLNDSLVKLETIVASGMKTCPDDVEHALTSAKEHMSSQWTIFSETFTAFGEDLNQTLASMNESCRQGLFEAVEDIKEELSLSGQQISLQLNLSTSTIRDELSFGENNIMRLISSVNNSVSEAVNVSRIQAVDEFVASNNDIIAEISRIDQRFDERFESFNDSIYSEVRIVEEAIVAEIRGVGDSMNNHISTLESRLSSKMTSVNDSLFTVISSAEKSVIDHTALVGQNLTNSMLDLLENIEENALKFEDSVANSTSAVELRLREQMGSFVSGLAVIESLIASGTVCDNSSLRNDIAGIERVFSTQVLSATDVLSDEIASVESRLSNLTLSIRDDIRRDVGATEENLKEELVHLNTSLADDLSRYEQSVYTGLDRVESFIKSGLTTTTQMLFSQVASVNQSLGDEILAAEARLRDGVEKVEVAVKESVFNAVLQMESELSLVETHLSNQIAAGEKKYMDEIIDINDGFNAKINNTMSEVTFIAEVLKTGLSNLENISNEQIALLKSSFDDLTKSILDNVAAFNDSTKVDLKQLGDTVSTSLDDNLGSQVGKILNLSSNILTILKQLADHSESCINQTPASYLASRDSDTGRGVISCDEAISSLARQLGLETTRVIGQADGQNGGDNASIENIYMTTATSNIVSGVSDIAPVTTDGTTATQTDISLVPTTTPSTNENIPAFTARLATITDDAAEARDSVFVTSNSMPTGNAEVTTSNIAQGTSADNAEGTNTGNAEGTAINNPITVDNAGSTSTDNAEGTTISNAKSTTIGNAERTIIGNAQSTTIGNAQSTTFGNTERTTIDNAQSTTIGNTERTTTGNAQSTTIGNTERTTIGNVEDTTIGNTEKTAIGNTQSTTIGNTERTTIGNAVDTTIGNTERTSIGNVEGINNGNVETITIDSTTTVNNADGTIIEKTTTTDTDTKSDTNTAPTLNIDSSNEKISHLLADPSHVTADIQNNKYRDLGINTHSNALDLLNSNPFLSSNKQVENHHFHKQNVMHTKCLKNMTPISTKPSDSYAIVYSTETQIDKRFLCDTQTDNGGWIVIQTRKHKTINFNRGWEDFKQGFGSLTGDFWLGLDVVHNLTKSGVYELRLEFDEYYAHYQTFSVGSEAENYELHVGSYDGTARDVLSVMNGMGFSTQDRDNDRSAWRHCAKEYGVAWWYNDCGRYTWSSITQGMRLSSSDYSPEIKMRLVDGV